MGTRLEHYNTEHSYIMLVRAYMWVCVGRWRQGEDGGKVEKKGNSVLCCPLEASGERERERENIEAFFLV